MRQFYDLMESYARADTDDARQQIQEEVWDLYGVEEAVHIIDMSGFSRLTQKRGIVHYLSMVRHMQLVTQPIIERFGGAIVKFEADNAFCRFPDVQKAIDASDPPPISGSTLIVIRGGSIYGNQATQAGRDCHQAASD